jgi:hypothetical protein
MLTATGFSRVLVVAIVTSLPLLLEVTAAASGFFLILATTMLLLPLLTKEESGTTAHAASFAAGLLFFSLLPMGLVRSPFDHEQVSMVREDYDYDM